jgi:hypothetical protein
MTTKLPTPNGCQILAFIQTRTVDGVPSGYAMFERPDGAIIVAGYNYGSDEWYWGHYFEDSADDAHARKNKAIENLMERSGGHWCKAFPGRKTPKDLGLSRDNLRHLAEALDPNRPERDKEIVGICEKIDHQDTLDRLEAGDKARWILTGAGYTEDEIAKIARAAKADWHDEDQPDEARAYVPMIQACSLF